MGGSKNKQVNRGQEVTPMSKEQEYVFVELRATFNLPVDDAEKLSYEELKELALDYFINDDGCNSANYEYEFDY